MPSWLMLLLLKVTHSLRWVLDMNSSIEKRIIVERMIEDVVLVLDKDPLEQMKDTDTIIREFVKALIKELK